MGNWWLLWKKYIKKSRTIFFIKYFANSLCLSQEVFLFLLRFVNLVRVHCLDIKEFKQKNIKKNKSNDFV